MLRKATSFVSYLACCTAMFVHPLDATLAQKPKTIRELSADVIIAGGSTAALAAAIASADSGATTVLIEPTDWIGGQLTSSGDTTVHAIKITASMVKATTTIIDI